MSSQCALCEFAHIQTNRYSFVIRGALRTIRGSATHEPLVSRFQTLFVPDWRGADAAHWLRLWAAEASDALWFTPPDDSTPHRDAWLASLEATVLAADTPLVLVAHGLGCIAAAHLAPEAAARVHGALLVAPCDPERRAQLSSFAPVPYAPLPYRSVMVASSNDPGCPVRLAGAYARAWGSEFVRMQNAGHIDTDSGHGPWPLGQALFQSLTHGDAPPAPAPRATTFPSERLAHP